MEKKLILENYKKHERYKNSEFLPLVYDFIKEMNWLFGLTNFTKVSKKTLDKFVNDENPRFFSHKFLNLYYLINLDVDKKIQSRLKNSLHKRCVSLLQYDFSEEKIRSLAKPLIKINKKSEDIKEPLYLREKRKKEYKHFLIKVYICYKLEIWKLNFLREFPQPKIIYLEFIKAILFTKGNFANLSFHNSKYFDVTCIIHEIYKFI